MSLRSPGGTPPPTTVDLDGEQLDLVELAGQICDRYLTRYPDESERYGRAGEDWCCHDNQWLLSWAIGDTLGLTDLDEQARWLARVLDARGFPVERLAQDLRIAADVVQESVALRARPAIRAALLRSADAVLATIEPKA